MHDDNQVTPHSAEQSHDQAAEQPAPEESGTDEFRLTIKKLEMPVRPRGVLAE